MNPLKIEGIATSEHANHNPKLAKMSELLGVDYTQDFSAMYAKDPDKVRAAMREAYGSDPEHAAWLARRS